MTSTTATSQQFCVRWNSHLGSLGAAFPQLLAGQRFVDVTLACEGHQVHCHRLVLAACSTYFESLLGENPCKHPIIILPRDIRLWEIQALVDFMYKGEVNVSQAGLADLLKCAETLQIRGLCGTDAALNLNQLTQMGIAATKVPTSSNGSTETVKSSNGLIAATEKTQPSLLSTALTTTGGKLVQNSVNKSMTSTAPKSTNNDTNSRLPVLSTQTTTMANKTLETTGQRRSERKSNQQQKLDEQDELVLDDDIEIKCEDLIIDEDELLKEHNVTTDDCDDEDMDNEKMNEEENFQNFQNQAQPSTPTTPQPNNENDGEENDISSPPLKIQTPLLKTYISRKPTQQSASPGVATPSSTSTTSTNTKSSQARGSIRVKSNENLFENYDKQIKITAATGSVVDGGGGKAGDYQIINQQTGKPSILPASLKFNHRTMEILLKPAKNAKKLDELVEDEASPGHSDGGDNDYENIICAPSFDEISGAYDDEGDNDEELNQYYDEMENLQNCDNDDYDFPTIIDDYDEPNEEGGNASSSFGGHGNADYSNSADLKPFMYQTPSIPMKIKNSKHGMSRAAPYSATASTTNNNVIMTQREMPNKSDMLEKLLANGGGRPPVAFVLRNPRGNQPRTYTTDALWAALMDVKSGESIYRASQIHKVPRKTLRNWMKRWDIKSAYPMPRQLQQAAERKKLIRDSLMTPPKSEVMIKPEASATSDPNIAKAMTYSIALH